VLIFSDHKAENPVKIKGFNVNFGKNGQNKEQKSRVLDRKKRKNFWRVFCWAGGFPWSLNVQTFIAFFDEKKNFSLSQKFWFGYETLLTKNQSWALRR
jgi:hypothetical protein